MLEKNILIVEDNAILSLCVATGVGKLGHAVAGQRRSGPQAATETLKGLPDLVILHMNLPGTLSASQAAAQIRARGAMPTIYVSTDPAALAQEREKGVAYTEFLGKPVAIGELQAAINRLIATFPFENQREMRESSFTFARSDPPSASQDAAAGRRPQYPGSAGLHRHLPIK